MRTYTISQLRAKQNEIDVDFMLHNTDATAPKAIAAPWSLRAQPGDQVMMYGPGKATFINLQAQYFLLAADMTALPALSANLKLLPDNAQGRAYIEILSEADKQDLAKPKNIEIIWVINPTPGSDESPLFHAIEQTTWPQSQISVWSACEFKTMKKIRHYFKTTQPIERSHLYLSSYWKKGDTEEQHKAAKQADAQQYS